MRSIYQPVALQKAKRSIAPYSTKKQLTKLFRGMASGRLLVNAVPTNVALTMDRGWERLPRGIRWSRSLWDRSSLRTNAYWTSTRRWSLKSADRSIRLKSGTSRATINLARCNTGMTVVEVNASINVHSSKNCRCNPLTKVNVRNEDMQNPISSSDTWRCMFLHLSHSFTCSWRNVVDSGGVAMMASRSSTPNTVTRRYVRGSELGVIFQWRMKWLESKARSSVRRLDK